MTVYDPDSLYPQYINYTQVYYILYNNFNNQYLSVLLAKPVETEFEGLCSNET